MEFLDTILLHIQTADDPIPYYIGGGVLVVAGFFIVRSFIHSIVTIGLLGSLTLAGLHVGGIVDLGPYIPGLSDQTASSSSSDSNSSSSQSADNSASTPDLAAQGEEMVNNLVGNFADSLGKSIGNAVGDKVAGAITDKVTGESDTGELIETLTEEVGNN